MGVHIDNEALTRLLDERFAVALPSSWPTKGWAWDVRWPDEQRLSGKLTGKRRKRLGSMTKRRPAEQDDLMAA